MNDVMRARISSPSRRRPSRFAARSSTLVRMGGRSYSFRRALVDSPAMRALLLLALVACGKAESGTGPGPAPTPTPTSDAGNADGGLFCGAKGLPDCPLQKWMKDNTSDPSTKPDLPAVA